MLTIKLNKLFSNNVNLREKIDTVVTSIYSNKKDDLADSLLQGLWYIREKILYI